MFLLLSTNGFLYSIRLSSRRKNRLFRRQNGILGSCDYISFPKMMESSSYFEVYTIRNVQIWRFSKISLREPSISFNSITDPHICVQKIRDRNHALDVTDRVFEGWWDEPCYGDGPAHNKTWHDIWKVSQCFSDSLSQSISYLVSERGKGWLIEVLPN